MGGAFLLGFWKNQGYSMREIEELTILYWEYKDLNFHIFMAEA